MRAPWREVVAGSGVFTLAGRHPEFGPVTAVAIELAPRRLGVISAPLNAADEAVSALLEAGDVTALIAPNIAHVSGLSEWSRRCPGAAILGPDDQIGAMARKTRLAVSPISTLRCDAGLHFRAAPATRTGAIWMRSERGAEPVVYLDEVLITMEQRPTWWVSRWLYRLNGVRPGLSVNHLFMRALCTDRRVHANAAMAFGEGAGAIIVAHGDPIISRGRVDEALSLLAPYAKA